MFLASRIRIPTASCSIRQRSFLLSSRNHALGGGGHRIVLRQRQRRNPYSTCGTRITMMPEGPEVRAVVDELQLGIGRRLVNFQFVSGRYYKQTPDGFRKFARTMTPLVQQQQQGDDDDNLGSRKLDWFEQSLLRKELEQQEHDDKVETATTTKEEEFIEQRVDMIREWNCKGKFIYILLDDGADDCSGDAAVDKTDNNDEDYQRSIWITLGMTGRFLSEKAVKQATAAAAATADKKLHIRWYMKLLDIDTNRMTKIYYSDTRSFGTVKFCLSRSELTDKLSSLGPDLLQTCTQQDFLNIMNSQKNQDKNICKFLMDQKNVAGIGNYILAEGLYRADIDPFAALCELDVPQKERLFQELQAVTKESYQSQKLTTEDDDEDISDSFEYQCYGQEVCKQRGERVHKETNGPHGRTIWYTDSQLFRPRHERIDSTMMRPVASSADRQIQQQQQSLSVSTRTVRPPLRPVATSADRRASAKRSAAEALTPGNAKLAAILAGDVSSVVLDQQNRNDHLDMRETQELDRVALAKTLLSGLKDSEWIAVLTDRLLESESFQDLAVFLEQERQDGQTVYPPLHEIFAALNACPLRDIKVVIVGQDPYHGRGQGHGLAFSVRKGVRPPPSLQNIFKELVDDVGIETPTHGNLESWATQGVLLLNTVLTVRDGQANSHINKGWEEVTDIIIRQVSERQSDEQDGENGLVFLSWGNAAAKKVGNVIDEDHSLHVTIRTSHPSPLGATKTTSPFIGSKCFSRANKALLNMGKDPIDWSVQ